MDKNRLLPIGSLVILKGGKRKVLIIGIYQKAAENNKVYDYSGLVYPFGYLRSDELFFFNSDKIDKIIHLGFSDEELEKHYDDRKWYIENNKEEEL